LGKGIKTEFLKELIRKERIDFIGIQETNKKSFEDSWLNSISSNRNFAWFWSSAKGRSGGLLVGICWGTSSSEGPQKHDLTMFS
jgi:hypothetical protein